MNTIVQMIPLKSPRFLSRLLKNIGGGGGEAGGYMQPLKTHTVFACTVFPLTYSISRFLVIALNFLTEAREDW